MHVLASYERVLSETLLGSRSSRPEHTYSLLIARVSILYRSVSKPCTDFFMYGRKIVLAVQNRKNVGKNNPKTSSCWMDEDEMKNWTYIGPRPHSEETKLRVGTWASLFSCLR